MHLDVNSTKIPNEAGKVIFISTYLRGQAWDWFEPYIRDYYGKDPKEWSATTINIFSAYRHFREYLENTFGDIDIIISYLDLPNRAYIPYFEAGLRSNVKDELARIDRLETLDQLIKVLVKIDNRNNERRYKRREIE
ncbi:Retrotransposon polyprotein [Penicillium samsonianum]|uniref:Retrotransposon polyprotein n=1 Tax=Penicillium samsonianum TaxID=1882272 RepID=UPI002547DB77|nr:Retrotransposon polyprotein [Penicillium samsonianum]KAJ6142772.1 Retrotransposon polyprotein [Penicillium samsonianum]